jgi:DNA-binding NarL/FixJ family response regulator
MSAKILNGLPAELIEQISAVLRHRGALHLLPGVVAALGSSITPERIEDEPGRAVDVSAVLALTGLFRSSDRLDLLTGVLLAALPWLPSSAGLILNPPPPVDADGITTRQVEALDLVSRGYSNAAVARKLFITEDTAKTHLHRLFVALRARSRAHAVRIGFELGLLVPDET